VTEHIDAGQAGCLPRLVDLFCKAGGMTKGYQRAGFYVVGVDVEPQPNYCGDEFVQMDAFAFLDNMLRLERVGCQPARYTFAAVHASPPCQHYLNLGAVNRAMGRTYDHPDLIAAVRQRIIATGLPYVIENGEDARPAMLEPVRICGTGLGLPLRRHRLFESNVLLSGVACDHGAFSEPRYWTSWRPDGEHRLATTVQVYGNAGGRSEWPAAMGIDWMTSAEMIEAIPPAYAEHVGRQLMAHVEREVAA
jgi:DNA (cytosine-5)-methyltransferase 1